MVVFEPHAQALVWKSEWIKMVNWMPKRFKNGGLGFRQRGFPLDSIVKNMMASTNKMKFNTIINRLRSSFHTFANWQREKMMRDKYANTCHNFENGFIRNISHFHHLFGNIKSRYGKVVASHSLLLLLTENSFCVGFCIYAFWWFPLTHAHTLAYFPPIWY